MDKSDKVLRRIRRIGYFMEAFLGCMAALVIIAYFSDFNENLQLGEMITFVSFCVVSMWVIRDARHMRSPLKFKERRIRKRYTSQGKEIS